MITVTDSGCRLHQQRRLTFMGEKAEVIAGVLHNLPQTGDDHFYVCEYGHSHRLSFNNDHVNLGRMPESTSERSTSGL
jgi:hypothetical protein